jgi:hypothetical protein
MRVGTFIIPVVCSSNCAAVSTWSWLFGLCCNASSRGQAVSQSRKLRRVLRRRVNRNSITGLHNSPRHINFVFWARYVAIRPSELAQWWRYLTYGGRRTKFRPERRFADLCTPLTHCFPRAPCTLWTEIRPHATVFKFALRRNTLNSRNSC